MSVYFVLRTHYHYPTGKYFKRFDDETVLGWFQRHWQGFEDHNEAYQYAETVLGCTVYGIASLFKAIAEESLPAPTSYRQLSRLLKKHLYAEGEIIVSENAVQVLTDDDELELAYYFFDDTFLAKEPRKAAYLLHDTDHLPKAIEEEFQGKDYSAPCHKIKPKGKKEGSTYLALLTYYDSSNLTDLTGAFCLRGVRLPDLYDYLQTATPSDDWPFELELLGGISRAFPLGNTTLVWNELLRKVNDYPVRTMNEELYEITHGEKAIKDRSEALQELLLKTSTIPEAEKRSPFVQAAAHVAQIHLHVETWNETPVFQQWILFDDLWMNTYPDLAKSVIRYAARWDVLS